MKAISLRQKIALILFGLYSSVILLELGLRLGGFLCLSLQEYRNKVSLTQAGTYRIMCLGESTTAVGKEYSYPSQLENILNQRNIGIKFAVINKGLSGTTTGSIVSHLEDNLKKYSPDMVITMMGINDGRHMHADREINNMKYENLDTKKVLLIFRSSRLYKLIKLIQLNIIHKLGEKKGTVPPEEIKLKNLINYKQAEKMYTEIIATDPENDRACFELAQLYMDDERYEKAREMCERAIEINPRNDWAYLVLGICSKKKIPHEETAKLFRKTLEINSSNYRAYIELGLLHKATGEYYKCEEVFKKAIKIRPWDEFAYAALIQCYEDQGIHKLAKEYSGLLDILGYEYYNPVTHYNYRKLKDIVTHHGIKLVCVQYPVRSLESLKKLLEPYENIIFVDNEKIFKNAIKKSSYDEYFIDIFGGNFGHCTPKGDRLLAENIANAICEEVAFMNE